MKQYRVEITREALRDMEDIYNYIAIDLLAPENAMGQYNLLCGKIKGRNFLHRRFYLMTKKEKRERKKQD